MVFVFGFLGVCLEFEFIFFWVVYFLECLFLLLVVFLFFKMCFVSLVLNEGYLFVLIGCLFLEVAFRNKTNFKKKCRLFFWG